MTPVDTVQELVIFPKPISIGMIVGSFALAALGGVVLPLTWMDQDWFVVGCAVFMLLLGLVLGVLLIRKRRRGNPDATLMLSPRGLQLMTGTTGVIAWRDLKSLGSFSMKGNQALVISIEKAAIDALEQSNFRKQSRKVDAAIGIHRLTFFQQQLEIPIPEVARLLHNYSIAHGGPALQPDP